LYLLLCSVPSLTWLSSFNCSEFIISRALNIFKQMHNIFMTMLYCFFQKHKNLYYGQLVSGIFKTNVKESHGKENLSSRILFGNQS
jgi:hypothetical protein